MVLARFEGHDMMLKEGTVACSFASEELREQNTQSGGWVICL